ncbi:MAG: flagellar hook-basal body complex protein FliE [Paracoccus sp. (in: a-proteobacteria)]|nr:flagellar hook-basal body complex protein FliE [Paracoccus sp. (in: a-proteobacteria)]
MITANTAVSAYHLARDAAAPQQSGGAQLARQFEAAMASTDSAAIAAMSGTGDTHVLVQSIAEAQLALEAAVAIRDKVVEAYQEILRMPV